MSKIIRFKNVQPDVEKILRRAKKYRDSDGLLMLEYYKRKLASEEKPLPGISFLSAGEFIEKMIFGDLPFPDTITRVRRRLQEKYPELRGSEYLDRKKHAREVKTEIHGL